MGAKRAVEGRSQPYDVLLAAYQKKSIGRPNAKDQATKPRGTLIIYLKKNTVLMRYLAEETIIGLGIESIKPQAVTSSSSAPEESFLDSDEEVENVMQSMRYSRPAPLAQKPYFFTKRRRQCFRLRDILLDAITPKSTTTTATTTTNAVNTTTSASMNNNNMNSLYTQQQYPLETSFISLNNTPHFW